MMLNLYTASQQYLQNAIYINQGILNVGMQKTEKIVKQFLGKQQLIGLVV